MLMMAALPGAIFTFKSNELIFESINTFFFSPIAVHSLSFFVPLTLIMSHSNSDYDDTRWNNICSVRGSLRWWITTSLHYQVKGEITLQRSSLCGTFRIRYNGTQIDGSGRPTTAIKGSLQLPPSMYWTLENKKLKSANSVARVMLLEFENCFLAVKKVQLTVAVDSDGYDTGKIFANALQDALLQR